MEIRAGEVMIDQDDMIEPIEEVEEYGKLTPSDSFDSDDANDKFIEKKPEYYEDNFDFLIPEYIDDGKPKKEEPVKTLDMLKLKTMYFFFFFIFKKYFQGPSCF